MGKEYSADEAVVSVHVCWPIGDREGVSERVTVRRPRLTPEGTLWLNTRWEQRSVRPGVGGR